MRTLGFVLAALALAPSLPADQAPKGAVGTVTLPLAEYDRLVDLGREAAKRGPLPPVPAVLSRADLRVRVADGTARGSLTLEGEVLRGGPTRVPLMAGPTLLAARLAGRPVPLFREGDLPCAVVTGPGGFSLAVDWATAVVAEPGRAAITFPVPAAGSARVALDLPGEQVDARVEPGVVTRRSAEG